MNAVVSEKKIGEGHGLPNCVVSSEGSAIIRMRPVNVHRAVTHKAGESEKPLKHRHETSDGDRGLDARSADQGDHEAVTPLS